ncbi:MAG TPA: AmmeMemoRadiSam system protein A [Vicinamibacterales bacterium]|nr:AmmeMemoRadiSam system protein A [Vicinamibacterales bacterium]
MTSWGDGRPVFQSDDRNRLLAIARRALEARVRRDGDPPPETGGALDTCCGAFVSIHRGDNLRGCLGRLETDWAIARVVAHLGRAVADSDPRFEPVTIDELDELSIEISALTPERDVRSIQEIEIGRHGLIVERGSRRGLLLPQVATEHSWDVETFVSHTCLKAGLGAEAWRHDIRIAVFEAQVFSEYQDGRIALS